MTTLPPHDAVAERAREILEAHWQPGGYTVPNVAVYPHQWLWDSCFHAVVWTHLGRSDRAEEELANLFAHQGDDGFVPHVQYRDDPDQLASFWGRSRTSSITQPPMYGHALAELHRHGGHLDTELLDAAVAGIEHLFDRRHATGDSGLCAVFHPWESGCDDSPRWDGFAPDGRFEPKTWRTHKGVLVEQLVHAGPNRGPVANAAFTVGSVGFNALVAFNAVELATVVEDDTADRLRRNAREIRLALGRRWDDELGCAHDWADPYRASCGVRTLDALLDVLLEDDPDSRVAAAQLRTVVSSAAFGGDVGPAGVHRRETVFDPDRYWRGVAWPQLTYLFWVAATRLGRRSIADDLAAKLTRGAWHSGFAEFWNPDDATSNGARPQSWTCLAAVVHDES